MTRILCVSFMVALLALCGCMTVPNPTAAKAGVSLVLLDSQLLAKAKQESVDGNADILAAVAYLREQANAAMTARPFTVVNKAKLPPSGDKHDYKSLAIYWWPNPDTPNGLPYVNRDGQRNPEANDYDGPQLHGVGGTSHTLALAYFFTGDEKYAARAALLLKTFFLDEATRMNPNMRYAQGIPGVLAGTRTGIIEGVGLATNVIDAALLIHGSASWRKEDDAALKGWYRQWLNWLETSELGKGEGKTKNNHAVWYAVQTTACALYLGEEEHARKILEGSKQLMNDQVRPDGSQPEELRRTKSWDYSVYTLQAWFALATMGKRVGVDLWSYQGPQGQSIPKALAFLLPYLDAGKPWPYKQIYDINPSQSLKPLIRQGMLLFGDSSCTDQFAKMGPENPDERISLLYPR